MEMYKIITKFLSAAILLCTSLSGDTYADDLLYKHASSCKIDSIREVYSHEGCPSCSLVNELRVIVRLKLCDASESTLGHRDWTVIIANVHPEMGEVVSVIAEEFLSPREVVTRWVDTLRLAKVNDLRVTASGWDRSYYPENEMLVNELILE
jgi:hypothetical protein